MIADRIGANQISVRLASTGSGDVRCVAVPLEAPMDPDASDIIGGHAYSNGRSESNSSLVTFTAYEEKVVTISYLANDTSYRIHCTQFTRYTDYPLTGAMNVTTASVNAIVAETKCSQQLLLHCV